MEMSCKCVCHAAWSRGECVCFMWCWSMRLSNNKMSVFLSVKRLLGKHTFPPEMLLVLNSECLYNMLISIICTVIRVLVEIGGGNMWVRKISQSSPRFFSSAFLSLSVRTVAAWFALKQMIDSVSCRPCCPLLCLLPPAPHPSTHAPLSEHLLGLCSPLCFPAPVWSRSIQAALLC